MLYQINFCTIFQNLRDNVAYNTVSLISDGVLLQDNCFLAEKE